MHTKSCVICGKTFTCDDFRGILCSPECRKERKRILEKERRILEKERRILEKERSGRKKLHRNCEICGEQFLPKTSRGIRCEDCSTNTSIKLSGYPGGKKKKKAERAKQLQIARERDRALSEKARKARDLGMSYGEYVAMLAYQVSR